jgi:hypothetical protein
MTGKHLASKGLFLDTFPRDKNKKAENFLKEIESKINLSVEEGLKTGAELRSSRNRNLKEAKKDIDSIQLNIRSPESKEKKYQGKKSIEEIALVIECLNELYGSKQTLSHAEVVGSFDWEEFNTFIIKRSEASFSNEKALKDLKSWILYHRRKGDILFSSGRWSWSARKR